ncbi:MULTISPECIES: tape measure protein [unclassified Spirosoma]|uniref:tape measure protein n=1 Tax=unclassified Spirosoma TaxID=2621999 RepID=UPI000968C0CF|nr:MULTISPECIES: tape measure protein [unclassified Spirosoma]MBN8824453.1 tape measure protein [Spirosoma sp.]OJW70084.1 MAG: hypothetical protein BGO59_25760 [Spirosoma sp. 48-14]
MSQYEQNVRFNFKLASELPDAIQQLERIAELTKQQGQIASSTADLVKQAAQQQKNDRKLYAEEELAITKEIARQMTLERKAQLDQQTAQLKASEAQNTAYVKASEQERAAIAKEIAKQTTQEQAAELKRQEIEREASETRKTTILREEEERRTAAVRAALLEQAQIAERLHEQTTLELKAELERQTLSVKAEADQQTAIIRGEQQRQTLLLRGELAEQKAAIQQHGQAFQELRNYIASAFGVYELIDFTKGVIEAKSKVDSFRAGLQQMIGTKAEADAVFARLLEMAKTTPFEVENLMEATFRLKAMGTATQDLIPTLEVLGNMAAVVGSEKLGYIAKAFTDIQNKGVLMKQELNQFADNGVPLYDLLAKSMGKTRDEVVKLAEAHEITFAQVKKALFDASQEGGRYYNLMAIQAQTLGGQVSNLKDKFFVAKAALGDYYEDGLQKVIGGLSSMIQFLAGSDSAIARNVAIIKAGASAWITYQLATNAAVIEEKAIAAAMVVKNAAIAASELVVGTYNLVMITATGTTRGFNTAQLESAVAARATWAALAANPLGAIIATVGIAITTYQAWKAATTEVTSAMGEQEVALKIEKANLNTLAQVALNAAAGTKERKDAIALLIKQYPQYFSGLDSEKVSNNDLRKILDSVNVSYMTRISLARQAYNLEGLAAKQKELFDLEKEFFSTLPKSITVQFDGDITRFVKALDAGGAQANKLKDQLNETAGGGAAFFGEAAREISKKFDAVEKDYAKVSQNMKSTDEVRIKTALDAENKRWEAQLSTLKKGTADYKTAEQKHLDELAKINGTYRENQEGAATNHGAKMKSIVLNSQLTVRDILLQTDNMSFEDKKKYYENLEKLEIEQINKTRVSRKASEDEIVALREQALQKIQAIHEKYQKIQDGLLAIERKSLSDSIDAEIVKFQERNNVSYDYIEKETKGIKQLAQEAKKSAAEREAAEKQLQTEKEKTIRMTEAAADAEEKATRKIINMFSEMLSKADPLLASIAKGFMTVIEFTDQLSGKSLQASQNALENAKIHAQTLKSIYDAGMGGTAQQVEEANQAVQKSRKDLADARIETATTVFAVMGAIYQVFSAIADAYNQHQKEVYQAIASGFARIREAYTDLYAFISKAAKDSHDEEMKNFKGTIEEKLQKIDDYYKREKAYAEGRDRIDAMLAYYQKAAQIQADAGTDAGKIMKGLTELALDQIKMQQQLIINQAELEIAKAGEIRDAKVQSIEDQLKSYKDAKEKEIDALNDAADKEKSRIDEVLKAKTEALEAELSAVKDKYDKEVALIKDTYDQELALLKDRESQERAQMQATYDLRQQLMQQRISDEIEEVAILDRVRNEALERYRSDEIARITATRDRILSTLTDETEKQQVITEYENQLQQLHDTVEQAKLDKSKGVALATKQLNKEQTEETKLLKAEETEALKKLDDEYQAKFKELAKERDEKLAQMKADELEREQLLKDRIKQLELDAANQKHDLEIATANKIQEIMEQMAKQEAAAAEDRAKANAEYANQVMQANRQIFEANKRMKIAELQAEIAILEGQKGLFSNNSAINAAIDALNQAIGTITALSYDTGSATSSGISSVFGKTNIVKETLGGGTGGVRPGSRPTTPVDSSGNQVSAAYDESGNTIELTYDPLGHSFSAYDANNNPITIKFATGYAPKTGKQYFLGTEYVDDPSRPNGRDTVPALLTKGERVLTVDQNMQLNGITNDELVRRALLVENLNMPNMADFWAGFGNMRLGLPDGLLSAGGREFLNIAELINETRRTRQVFESKKLVNISIDRQGFSESEIGQQSTVRYWNNIFKR